MAAVSLLTKVRIISPLHGLSVCFREIQPGVFVFTIYVLITKTENIGAGVHLKYFITVIGSITFYWTFLQFQLEF